MQTFDFVIVGAGSAGCVLANRLTESGQHRVLLLEAGGPDNHLNIRLPAGFHKLFKSAFDWNYQTVPQPQLANRSLFLPRGKTLGGSSSLNAMVYVRGHRADYDGWAALGNAGWSYNEVLPYFKKAENQGVLHDSWHGTEGPLHVQNRPFTHPLSEVFLDAAEASGLSRTPDFNGAEQEGAGVYQVTQNRGRRWSAADAYLRPALQRPNLRVETGACVQRIVVENGVATGVEYRQNGQLRRANAACEVILSAGAYNSPQILLLSGIGDRSELQHHGIGVKAHLPGVGRNLQDHLAYFVWFESSHPRTLDKAEQLPDVLGNLLNALLRRRGPFTSNVAETGGFFRTSADEVAPDQQIHFAPCFFVDHGFGNPKKRSGFTLAGKVLIPKSRGVVTLNSADPAVAPQIDHRYLSHPDDLHKSVEGYKFCQKIALSAAFEPYRSAPWGTSGRLLTNDAEIEQQICQHAQTLYHPVGTCKMGTDPEAVVDASLRVHGVARLRVVDASVMPVIPRGNTHAPTVMVAEKAADLIYLAHR